MAIKGKGVTITLTPASGTDIISGCCVREIGDLSMTADEIDVTCHGPSNVRKKIQGLVDLGTIDITIEYDSAATAQSLYAAMTGGESYTVAMTYPTTPAETLTFTAFISGLGTSVPKEDAVTQIITLTLDGSTEPAWETGT